jgi:hypothetical protein
MPISGVEPVEGTRANAYRGVREEWLEAASLEARRQKDRRYDSDGGENEEIGPLEPSVHDPKMLNERKAERRDQKQHQRERQSRNEPRSSILRFESYQAALSSL